jgi:hypothetical protein
MNRLLRTLLKLYLGPGFRSYRYWSGSALPPSFATPIKTKMPAGWIAQASILKEFNDEMAPFGPRLILLEALFLADQAARDIDPAIRANHPCHPDTILIFPSTSPAKLKSWPCTQRRIN